jgi:hypothetical protein
MIAPMFRVMLAECAGAIFLPAPVWGKGNAWMSRVCCSVRDLYFTGHVLPRRHPGAATAKPRPSKFRFRAFIKRPRSDLCWPGFAWRCFWETHHAPAAGNKSSQPPDPAARFAGFARSHTHPPSSVRTVRRGLMLQKTDALWKGQDFRTRWPRSPAHARFRC